MTSGASAIRRFDWMGVVLYPLAVILMESFWVYPWLVWIGNWPMWAEARPPLHLISVILTLALSLAATRFLSSRETWKLSAVRGSIIGAGLVVFFLVLLLEYPAPQGTAWFSYFPGLLADTLRDPSTIVLGMLALIYLWWRGIVLGGATSYYKDIYRSFIMGMVALIFLLIVWQLSSGSDWFGAPDAGLGWNVIAFFFFGLLAIAVCHLYNMRRTMAKEDAAQTSVWRWLPIMLGVIGGMVLVGFGVVALFSPEFFRTVGTVANGIGWFFGKVIDIISIPLSYVFEAIMWVLKLIISLLRSPDTGEDTSGNITGMDFFEQVSSTATPMWLQEAVKWFGIVLISAVIIFVLYKAVNRFAVRKKKDDIEEIHESLFSLNGLKDDLLGFLNGLRGRMAIKHGPRRRWSGEDDLSGRLDIREIYRRIQREGEKAGFPRRPYETVEEYARRIEHYVPDLVIPLDGIDEAYSSVRYGESTLAEEQVRGTNSLWQELRRVLRRMRGET